MGADHGEMLGLGLKLMKVFLSGIITHNVVWVVKEKIQQFPDILVIRSISVNFTQILKP